MAVKKGNKKIKCGYVVTPVGKALWVSAPNPSPYDDSKMEASIILDAEATEIFKKNVIAECSEAAEELGLDINEVLDNYLKPNTDADGNLTGEYRIKAKTSMQYMPSFADAKGVTFKPDSGFTIPNKSDIRLSIGLELQIVKPNFKGIVARLRGIQIISLKSFGADFDEVEGDFSYEATDTPAANQPSWGTPSSKDNSGWE